MTTLVTATAVGFLAARLVWVALRPTFAVPQLVRANYRGRTVITAAGAVLPAVALLVEGARSAVGALGIGAPRIDAARLMVLLAALGFGLVGLVDDLVGARDRRGFRGHLAALAHGRLTTGGLKLFGGVAVALVVVSPATLGPGGRRVGQLLADAALVALSANLANLFDARPGRAIKAGTLAFVVLAAATAAARGLTGVAVVVGAGLGLLVEDLHERVMLGDVGANVLGATLGLGAVLACSAGVRSGVLVVVAAMNLASEVVSFSAVIERFPPLRALDRAGRAR